MVLSQYAPKGVMNEGDLVVPEVAVEEGEEDAPAIELTIWSMQWEGKGSLGQCLLRSI
jgi:hypothetical protein